MGLRGLRLERVKQPLMTHESLIVSGMYQLSFCRYLTANPRGAELFESGGPSLLCVPGTFLHGVSLPSAFR